MEWNFDCSLTASLHMRSMLPTWPLSLTCMIHAFPIRGIPTSILCGLISQIHGVMFNSDLNIHVLRHTHAKNHIHALIYTHTCPLDWPGLSFILTVISCQHMHLHVLYTMYRVYTAHMWKQLMYILTEQVLADSDPSQLWYQWTVSRSSQRA